MLCDSICRWRGKMQSGKHWEVCLYIKEPFHRLCWLELEVEIDVVVECFRWWRKLGQLWWKLIWTAFFVAMNFVEHFLINGFTKPVCLRNLQPTSFYLNHGLFLDVAVVYVFEQTLLLDLSKIRWNLRGKCWHFFEEY